jgi:hypothetical protein
MPLTTWPIFPIAEGISPTVGCRCPVIDQNYPAANQSSPAHTLHAPATRITPLLYISLPAHYPVKPPTHPMRTRVQDRIFLPCRLFNLVVAGPISPIPCTYCNALSHPNWSSSCILNSALMKNFFWCLVPKPPGVNVMLGKWVYRNKFHDDDSLSL